MAGRLLGESDALEAALAAADRLGRLQVLSQRLAGARTVEDVIDAVIETLDPPHGATARGLWLVDAPTDSLMLARQAGMEPETANMFRRMDLGSSFPGAIALRERRTVVSPSPDDSIERFPDLGDVPRTAQGFIVVPLVVEDDALGVVAFGYNGPLEASAITFLEAAAANIAQNLQRARLSETLERRSEDVAFLADITRAAITATDHRDLMQRVADTAVPRLGEICTIHFIPEAGSDIETVAAHADPARAGWANELARTFPFDRAGEHGVAYVLRTGRSAGQQDASAIAVPLRSEGRVIGALQVVAGQTHRSHPDRDVALVESVAGVIGDALRRRWLTEQHRHIATALQRAFLPPALPSIAGLDVAAAYWPAGAANDVGGDFYDLFTLGEHEWAILIGDACGNGPDAAATAAIARHTARGGARHGLAHHEVLEWVNQAVMHSDRDLFCTACYATMRTRPDGGCVDVALATVGHPFPIVVRPGEAATVGEPGTLLGVFPDPEFSVRQTTLMPGDAIVFYTDGITDLPPPHDRTEAGLQDILAEQPAATAADIIEILRRDLDQRVSVQGRADDAALLVVRNAGAGSP